MFQIQGFNFDPDGEYVRQWLPELARMPAEWIHHPWDAPVPVLKSAGVDLGSNYPMPIIDIDEARDRLTEAIMVMQENEAAGRAESTTEVVFDNSDTTSHLATPKAAVMEITPCPASSSYDQRVPSFHNSKSVTPNKKRMKPMDEDMHLKDNLLNNYNGAEPSKLEEDMCSTAESSTSKKQMTTSVDTLSVPGNYCCSTLKDTQYHRQNSS